AQTAVRSLLPAASKGGGSRAAERRSALYKEARRARERQIELFCTTSEYFGAPGKKNFDSDLHTTLDIMGMASGPLEPVGMAADLLNAFLYASEGDWGNAGISLGGFVPVAGTVAAGARLGKKAYDALDAADEVEAIARAAKKVSTAGNMQKQVERGQAPRTVKEVHGTEAGVTASQPHVHFTDETAINLDGTIHKESRGVPKLTKKEKEWLAKNGWPTELRQ
ncbi:hypothetical protein, partial [Adlercreutzia shanghongiae]